MKLLFKIMMNVLKKGQHIQFKQKVFVKCNQKKLLELKKLKLSTQKIG